MVTRSALALARLKTLLRFDEGIAELERAHALDPLSLVIEVNGARCRYYARRFDQAVELLEPLGQREPNYWIVHAILGQTYLAMGRLADAIRELERACTLLPESPRNLGVLGDAYGRLGRRADALKLPLSCHVVAPKCTMGSPPGGKLLLVS